MRSAAVYSCRQQPRGSEREVLIHAQVEAALATLATLDRLPLPLPEPGRSFPGLVQVKGGRPTIALGRTAHTRLADVQKRTLIASDLDLEGDSAADVQDIEQLFWSCTNTLGVVALGDGAWTSIQLLPVHDRRFYNVPPLCMKPTSGTLSERGVLIVNHDESEGRAMALADVLDRSGMAVECVGPACGPTDSNPTNCWSNDAFIHIHVGEHTLGVEMPRLVDSWYSERMTLQFVSKQRASAVSSPCLLMIEDEANGFICETADQVVTACREVLEDQVLQHKLIAAGQNSVASLARNWLSIAEDLLA